MAGNGSNISIIPRSRKVTRPAALSPIHSTRYSQLLDIDPTQKILLYALVWFVLLVGYLYRMGSVGRTVGLPFAFLTAATFAYGGALVHLAGDFNPDADPYLRAFRYSRATVADGFEVACLGMVAASLGSWIVTYYTSTRKRFALRDTTLERTAVVSRFLIWIGLGASLFSVGASRLQLSLEGLQAVFLTTGNYFIAGSCGLIAYKYQRVGKQNALIWTLICALIMPIIMLVTTAILADSVVASLILVSFFLALQRARRHAFTYRLVVFSAVFVGCVVFAIGYMQSRKELRGVVWSGASVTSAISQVIDLASRFDPASIGDDQTLVLIEQRLDQSVFIGLAIEGLRINQNYENGSTIGVALLGWVPRFIWPDKPQAGGSELISKYTGYKFNEQTTFGTGPVFEYYVNFGLPGVAFGLLILGMVLRYLDIRAYRALQSDSPWDFSQSILLSIPLIAPLASSLFMVTALTVALAVSTLFKYLIGSGRR